MCGHACRCHETGLIRVFFISGLDKPNLVEVGPYVYRQKMEKVDVNFSTSEPSVTYKVAKQYFFAPELSGPGTSEDDYVIVPNIPLFGAFQKLAKESSVAKNIFKGLLVRFIKRFYCK